MGFGIRSVLLWLDGTRVDAWQVLRSLSRSKTFTALAALTFALGIGVNVAVFSVLDRHLFRPLPYALSERLTQVQLFASRIDDPVVAAMMPYQITTAIRQEAFSFDGLAFEAGWLDTPIPGSGQDPLVLLPVSTNSLSVLGVAPVLGRDFRQEDGRPGSEIAVLLTWEAWRARFGAAPETVSSSWQTGRRQYRVVGVLPREFFFPSSRLVERVDGLAAVKPSDLSDGRLTVAPVARLRPGVSWQAAQAELDVLVRRHPWVLSGLRRSAEAGRLKVTVTPLQSGLTVIVGPYLWLTSYVVWVVLCIACVNLSTLLLMRGRSRQQSTAVRAAMGASATRLVRLGLFEAGALCFAGGAIGWSVSAWLQTWVVSVVPPSFRGLAVPASDRRILATTILVAGLSAVIAAVVPAYAARRIDLVTVLRIETPTLRGWRATRSSALLLAVEAGFGVVIAVGAAAVVPDFLRFLMHPQGFRQADLFVATVNHDWSGAAPDQRRQVDRVRTILRVVRELPHVEGASVALPPPFARPSAVSEFWSRRGAQGRQFAVGPQLFQTLQTPLVAGRELLATEVGDVQVALLNETGARALWPEDPFTAVVGRSVQTGHGFRQIVGVVRDILDRPGASPTAALFLPVGAAEMPPNQTAITVIVRMAPNTTPDGPLLATRLNEHFPSNAARVVSVSQQLAPFTDRPRFLAVLFGALAFVAVLLVAVGVYGVASVECAQRHREMAIRLALGASAARVRRHLFAQVLFPVAVGSAIGLFGAGAALRMLRATVKELASPGGMVYVLAALVMIGITSVAVWWSSRRLSAIDPAVALRSP